MKSKCILALIVLMAIRPTAYAEELWERNLVPWAKTSKWGNFLFKMVPTKWHWDPGGEKIVVDREAFGVAYSINWEGEFVETWRTTGWYADEGYLSQEGRYLVRIGPLEGDQVGHKDIAIAFYDRGKLLKEYQVKDLVKNSDLIEHVMRRDSATHYLWRPEIQAMPNDFIYEGGHFHFVVIDKTEYIFEVATGQIFTTGIDAKARSSRQIEDQKEDTAAQQGKALLEKSSFKKAFEDHFELSHIEAWYDRHLVGPWFEGPQWRAYLIPRKKYARPCKVDAVFPITKAGQIEASITPEEIEGAFRTALAHPFVSRRFEKGGATRLTLEVTGDRLHWDTPELQAFLKKLKGFEPKNDQMREWASLYIDEEASQSGYIRIYLNTKTKELIYEDNTKSPWEPILLDATGTRH